MSLSGAEMASVSEFMQSPADKYGNSGTLEVAWAMKAFQHAEVYFNLLCSVDPKLLKLTQMDDQIYEKFREEFGKEPVDLLDEDKIKSSAGKQKWREFCNQFEQKVEDWNMATLLRLDTTQSVSDQNCTIVPRIQFLAIEITRNREGYNEGLREKFKKGSDQTSDDTSSSLDQLAVS